MLDILEQRVARLEAVIGTTVALYTQSPMAAIIGDCAFHTDVKVASILSVRRDKAIIRARFAVCWVAREGLNYSYQMIAAPLGDRDHSTIIHACRRAEYLRATDPEFLRLTNLLITLVEQRDLAERACL